MVRAIILLFIAVMAIFFLVTLFHFDYATSVEAWLWDFETIMTNIDILWIPLYPWAAVIIACYIIAARKKRKITTGVTTTYMLLTVPYLLILTYFNAIGSQGYMYDLFLVPKFIIPSLTLFIIGQLFFLLISAKNIRKKHA